MLEKLTPPSTGFLVRDGRTHILMITLTPMWEITTSVGILLGCMELRSAALPWIQIIQPNTALFHSAATWKLLTFLWTMIVNLTTTWATRTPQLKRKIFLPRSQSALLSWWRLGLSIKMQDSLLFAMKPEKFGSGPRFWLESLTQSFHSDLKIPHRP